MADEYVARLVAHLRSKPSRSYSPSPEHNYTDLLPSLGNAVRRPDGVPSLGNVLRRHPHIFRLHAVGASDAVSLVPAVEDQALAADAATAAAVDVPAAEAAYIARLVAHLRGKPQVNLAQLGHNVVSKPGGAPSLGTVLRQHPEVFSQHRVGTSITVSLVSGAPSRPKGRKAENHAEVEPANLAAAIKDALQEAEKEQVEQNEQIEEARRSYFESQRQREADDRVIADPPHSSDSEQMHAHAFVCTVVEQPPPPTLVLKFWHGTSWASAQAIKSHGFKVSTGEKQLLGRGVYVAKFHKALRFAQDESRHHSPEGGLVECQVRFSNPKFVTSDDDTWQSEGHDACRVDHTSQSSHLEWCLKEASQVP